MRWNLWKSRLNNQAIRRSRTVEVEVQVGQREAVETSGTKSVNYYVPSISKCTATIVKKVLRWGSDYRTTRTQVVLKYSRVTPHPLFLATAGMSSYLTILLDSTVAPMTQYPLL